MVFIRKLSVRGHCTCTMALQASLSLAKTITGGSGHKGQYQGGITLALFGSARWSLAYQGVFLIFEGILSALALLGSHPIVSGGVQANLAFSVGWLPSMGLFQFYCKDPCLTSFQFFRYPRLKGAGCVGKHQSCGLVLLWGSRVPCYIGRCCLQKLGRSSFLFSSRLFCFPWCVWSYWRCLC